VAGLPDLLLYASMIDDGILLLQDGALMATWRYAGPESRLRHSRRDGRSCAAIEFRLEAWLWMVGALRCDSFGSHEYAKQGAFPDSVTSLIDDERRAQFKAEGRTTRAPITYR